jgi:hypothetical protein
MTNYQDAEGNPVQVMMLSRELAATAAAWCDGVPTEEMDPFSNATYPAVNVRTPDGAKRASLGDYIIKKQNGDFDVQRPLQFLTNHKLREN